MGMKYTDLVFWAQQVTKKGFFLIACFSTVLMYSQITFIPDPNFEQALIDLGIDSDGEINGQVLTADIDTVQTLNLNHRNIADLTGIEDFAALVRLNILANHIQNLDTSGNLNLETLICSLNPLRSLNISQNQNLKLLDLSVVHRLRTVDLSNAINLETLILDDCWLTELDISSNINLKNLYAAGSSISEIDLTQNIHLQYLDIFGVNLNEIDVSNNTELKEFYCGNFDGVTGQDISEIDISSNVNLELFHAERLYQLNRFNAKNGNNEILKVVLSCDFENYPCMLSRLDCVEVDDETAANNNEFPYNTWIIDADFFYSEDCTLGVTRPNERNFLVSENPVNQNLQISSAGFSGDLNLEIYDFTGKLLKRETVAFYNHLSLDVSQLAAGIYILKLIDNSNHSITSRFLKR